MLCGREGTIVARFAAMTPTAATVGDPVAISPEGKIVARFGREKITDVPQPVPGDMFLTDDGLEMLTMGLIPLGYQTKWRTPKGQVGQQPAVKGQYFVTRFKEDGTYTGKVALDIPFKPLQLGVFSNGDFLIAGQEEASGSPRVAIVGSDGAFRRWVELKGDVHARTESEMQGGAHDKTALPRFAPGGTSGESLTEVLGTSQIMGSGSDLLLFRPFGSSVFSISPGGEAHTRRLNAPGERQIFAMKPAHDSWIVEFTHHQSGDQGEEFEAYAFDPVTGDPLMQYIFPNDLGFGLACADGAQFTFVMADTAGDGVKLVRLAPGVPSK